MWELDYKESWAPKNWCSWTVGLQKALESPLDCKEIQPVHPKGNQSWIFIGRTDSEAETPILWPPDVKNWLIGKDPDTGKDWRQEEKGKTEDEMVGWHHWLNGHEFEQAPRVGDGQGSLACCSPWGHKELDMTEQLNWTVTQFRCSKIWANEHKWALLLSSREQGFNKHSLQERPMLVRARRNICSWWGRRANLEVSWWLCPTLLAKSSILFKLNFENSELGLDDSFEVSHA